MTKLDVTFIGLNLALPQIRVVFTRVRIRFFWKSDLDPDLGGHTRIRNHMLAITETILSIKVVLQIRMTPVQCPD